MTGAEAIPPGIVVFVLAAGGSVRLGQPKQLVPFRGATLIHHAAATALEAGLGPVTVVLGAHAAECRAALVGLDVTILVHEGWAAGLGSSIAAAARAAPAGARAMLLTTCDQPDVSADDLRRLADAWRRSGAAVAASQYGGTVGIPALFAAASFPALAALSGERGAKALLVSGDASMVAVSCPSGARDVDTPEDVAALS